MKKQITMEQKLADWELAFISMPNMQNHQSLKGLIEGLKTKIRISLGVVA